MRFYVTFGQQYPREPHPSFPGAHRDGWVEIVALTEQHARVVAHRELGRAWSSIYSEDDWDPALFPLGRLGPVLH